MNLSMSSLLLLLLLTKLSRVPYGCDGALVFCFITDRLANLCRYLASFSWSMKSVGGLNWMCCLTIRSTTSPYVFLTMYGFIAFYLFSIGCLILGVFVTGLVSNCLFFICLYVLTLPLLKYKFKTPFFLIGIWHLPVGIWHLPVGI